MVVQKNLSPKKTNIKNIDYEFLIAQRTGIKHGEDSFGNVMTIENGLIDVHYKRNIIKDRDINSLEFVSDFESTELEILKSDAFKLVEDFNYEIIEKMGRVELYSLFLGELGAGFAEVLDDIARHLGESKIVVYDESYYSQEVIERFVALGAELKRFAE